MNFLPHKIAVKSIIIFRVLDASLSQLDLNNLQQAISSPTISSRSFWRAEFGLHKFVAQTHSNELLQMGNKNLNRFPSSFLTLIFYSNQEQTKFFPFIITRWIPTLCLLLWQQRRDSKIDNRFNHFKTLLIQSRQKSDHPLNVTNNAAMITCLLSSVSWLSFEFETSSGNPGDGCFVAQYFLVIP